MKIDKLEDGRLHFEGFHDFLIENTLHVELIIESIIPFDDKFIFWVNLPSKGLRVIYRHPRGLLPRIYVFGMGELVPELVVSERDLHEWRYDGWLLPRQGFVLSWSSPEK
jgi:hypothetical protein